MHKLSDLNTWKKAIKLSIDIYKIRNQFADNESFGLISQIQRPAVFIPSNEGAGRNSCKEFARLTGISIGSSNEMLTQMIIAN